VREGGGGDLGGISNFLDLNFDWGQVLCFALILVLKETGE